MKAELKQQWIKALESGDYKKGKERLYSKDGYCCLGVLGKILGLTIDNIGCQFAGDESISTEVIHYPSLNKHLNKKHYTDLTTLNDLNDTFEPVIEYIKEHIHE